jgi:hypothetical protein
MKINLISSEQFERLLEIQLTHPNLTYQNVGYDYPNKNEWSKEDTDAHKEVSDLLSKHIIGFSEFNHFKLSKDEQIQLRVQYNYGADDNTTPFTGVGYLLLSELLNGFK